MLVNHHHGAVTTLSSFSQTCHHMMLAGLIRAVLAFGIKTCFSVKDKNLCDTCITTES